MTPFLQAAITVMLPGADPAAGCRECGFDWTEPAGRVRAHLDDAPERFAILLREPTAARAVPAHGVWSPGGYAWHVVDLVRAWSERLHSLAADPGAPWAGFDPDELAGARHYDELPVASAPWALARAVDALDEALAMLDVEGSFDHPEWGRGTVADALRWLAHEVVHHDLDVRRGLGLVGSGAQGSAAAGASSDSSATSTPAG